MCHVRHRAIKFMGVLDQWPIENGARLSVITSGRLVETSYAVGFSGKHRDECLNAHWLPSLTGAEDRIGAWREDYIQERLHSSLGNLPPAEFAQRATPAAVATLQPGACPAKKFHTNWTKNGGKFREIQELHPDLTKIGGGGRFTPVAALSIQPSTTSTDSGAFA